MGTRFVVDEELVATKDTLTGLYAGTMSLEDARMCAEILNDEGAASLSQEFFNEMGWEPREYWLDSISLIEPTLE